jgi:drug/metabolite transporter (DMT)-like permease
MAGVAVVARAGGYYEHSGDVPARKLPLVLALSLLASLAGASALTAGQAAVPIFGEIETVWLARVFGLIAIATFAFVRRTSPVPQPRWLPLLLLMGALDVTALAAIMAAGGLPEPAFAAVVSSAFTAVTVLLARLFLKEAIAPTQVLGMALIFGGVAALAGI